MGFSSHGFTALHFASSSYPWNIPSLSPPPPRIPFNVLPIKLAGCFTELITKTSWFFLSQGAAWFLPVFSCNLLEAKLTDQLCLSTVTLFFADVTFDVHLEGLGRESHKGLPAMLLLP